MLANSSPTVAGRIRFLLFASALACAVPFGIYAAHCYGVYTWPNASNPICVVLGILAGLFIVFEMILYLRKQHFRGSRRLPFSTRWWTKWHVWIGLLSLPAAVLHSGFSWGGSLSATFMVLFLLTIASGVWGTVMQQWLPSKMRREFPGETIVAGMVFVSDTNARELDATINTVIGNGENDFFRRDLKEYIAKGTAGKSALASADRSRAVFEQLRRVYTSNRAGREEAERVRKYARQDPNRRMDAVGTLEADAAPEEKKILAALDRLEQLADERRSWGRQKSAHRWLHAWLVLHVPLSFAVLLLLFAHAFFAIKWGW